MLSAMSIRGRFAVRSQSVAQNRFAVACVVGLAFAKLACGDASPQASGSGGKAGAAGSSAGSSAQAGSGGVSGDSNGGSSGADTAGGGAGGSSTGGGGAGGDSAGGNGGTSTGGDTTLGGSGGTGGSDNWTLPVGATLASCVPSNWTVTATTSADSNPPAYAIDGVPSTRWSSGQGQDSSTYYQIDFGGWVTLKQLVLDNSTASGGDYPRGYQILGSKDGVLFPRVIASNAVVAEPDGDILTIDFDPVPVQSIRIGTTISSGSWWSIQELRLSCQGSDDGTPPVDPLLCTPPDSGAGGEGGQASVVESPAFDHANWTATASSTDAKATVQAAFDGSIATRWSTGVPQAGAEWYLLDLGSVACVSSLLMVSGGGDFAAAYTIEVSVDGITYEQVAKGAGSAVMDLQFKSHSARYIRINQVGTAGAHWWSIQELDVQP